VGPGAGDAVGAVDAKTAAHRDGRRGGGGPSARVVVGADLEGEIAGGKGGAVGQGGDVDHDAVEAAGVGGKVGCAGGLAGEERDFVGGDGVVIGAVGAGVAAVEGAAVVEDRAAGDGRDDREAGGERIDDLAGGEIAVLIHRNLVGREDL